MLGLYDFFSESAMNPNIFRLQGKKKTTNETTFLLIALANFYFIKLHSFLRIFIHLNTLHHL